MTAVWSLFVQWICPSTMTLGVSWRSPLHNVYATWIKSGLLLSINQYLQLEPEQYLDYQYNSFALFNLFTRPISSMLATLYNAWTLYSFSTYLNQTVHIF